MMTTIDRGNHAVPVGRSGDKTQMNSKTYEFDAVIQSSEIGQGGAYVLFPYDLRQEFGKGRVSLHATFDGEPYDGSIVNMGVTNPDGSVCCIIGVRKDIREKIGKQPGDRVRVKIWERELQSVAEKKRPIAIPEELAAILANDTEAKAFFESLTDGYKRGYCDWIGGAKQAVTREVRASKALIMLQNKQKTLKT